jgi:hypothetical protein
MASHDVVVEYTFGITFHPRGKCACGWTGPIRKSDWRAMRDANKHRRRPVPVESRRVGGHAICIHGEVGHCNQEMK